MRSPRLFTVVLVIALQLAAARVAIPADDSQAPGTAVVEQLQGTLLDVMKNADQLGVEGRYAKLEPVITATHDFDYVTPRVFGEDWKQLSDDQKKTVQDLYRRASIMTIARQFDGYHGERFEIIDEKPTSNGERLVRSEMRQPSGDAVHFNYLLREGDGQWRIINTVYDGVSGVTMDRSRYQPLLQQKGADALIAQLRKEAGQ